MRSLLSVGQSVMSRCFASTGVAPILPESHRMSVPRTIEASQHPPGPLTRDRRPAQTSEVVDTPPRTRAWNSVVAVLFLVVAMWGGYTAIGPATGRDCRRLRSRGIRHLATVGICGAPSIPSVISSALPADRRGAQSTHGRGIPGEVRSRDESTVRHLMDRAFVPVDSSPLWGLVSTP